jgi:hypothetical protein
MPSLSRKPSGRHVTRTTPRLQVVALAVVDALGEHPGLGAQLRSGIIEVDSDACRARGHFLITPWHAGVTVFRSSADGLRADLIAELEAVEPEAIANIIAKRMSAIAALKADGLDDPVAGTDSDLLPDRVIGVDSRGNDIYERDLDVACTWHEPTAAELAAADRADAEYERRLASGR